MVHKNIPKRLFNFGCKFMLRGLDRNSAYEEMTKTVDISEYCDFGFYYLVYYYPAKDPTISELHRELGR